uniref:BEACH-type PH domain-containing protein n=1 Tax=Wuchereria bancrofti TaxID=6293 RepID=A0A1I8ESQ1_WUCBA
MHGVLSCSCFSSDGILIYRTKRLSRTNTLFIRWSCGDLVEIYKRHHLLKDTALEIFLYFMNFIVGTHNLNNCVSEVGSVWFANTLILFMRIFQFFERICTVSFTIMVGRSDHQF